MFEGKNMNGKYTKRDYLAKDRTYLANERTILAYWRTALAFLIFGAFLIKFLPSIYIIILALVSIFFGIILFIYGTARYFRYKEKINSK
jgi:putative membrane protein